MERRLLVLGHAKSSWAESHIDDWERPLNDRGRRDAPNVGDLIRRLSLLPDLIITSDAVRAETTARMVAEAAGYAGPIVLTPSLYHATPNAIIDVLQAAEPGARAIMIVGHNPGLEDLVGRLTGEHVSLPTAALVHLGLGLAEWNQLDLSTDATLIDIWRPAEL